VLDQLENRVSLVLCHAKVSCASRAESAYPRDKAFSGDKILTMNAFWNSFETLLGLGVEPRDLTFVQISLRGIIVFLITLATVRLGHKRSLSRKTPFDAVLLVILAAVLSRAINGSASFFRDARRWRGFSCAPSPFRFSHILFPSVWDLGQRQA
jgi:hypothetical protein